MSNQKKVRVAEAATLLGLSTASIYNKYIHELTVVEEKLPWNETIKMIVVDTKFNNLKEEIKKSKEPKPTEPAPTMNIKGSPFSVKIPQNPSDNVLTEENLEVHINHTPSFDSVFFSAKGTRLDLYLSKSLAKKVYEKLKTIYS